MSSTKTVTSIGLSGLAKLSCTPPQHTGMSVEVSSVGGAVTLGGTVYVDELQRQNGVKAKGNQVQ